MCLLCVCPECSQNCVRRTHVYGSLSLTVPLLFAVCVTAAGHTIRHRSLVMSVCHLSLFMRRHACASAYVHNPVCDTTWHVNVCRVTDVHSIDLMAQRHQQELKHTVCAAQQTNDADCAHPTLTDGDLWITNNRTVGCQKGPSEVRTRDLCLTRTAHLPLSYGTLLIQPHGSEAMHNSSNLAITICEVMVQCVCCVRRHRHCMMYAGTIALPHDLHHICGCFVCV